MMKLTDTHFECKLVRVVYGRLPGEVLHVRGGSGKYVTRLRLKWDLGREPTDEEVEAEFWKTTFFKPGRDAIVYVDQIRKMGNVVICRYLGAVYDVPPSHPLGDYDKKIVEVIRTGAHLTPRVTPGGIGPYIRSSQIVVRARLTKITDKVTEWRVAGVLYAARAPRAAGKPRSELSAKAKESDALPKLDGTTIKVELDTWRLRAESIINYQAAQAPHKVPAEKDIKKEFARLVAAELKVGREAILFLSKREKAKGGPIHKLVGILHDVPKKGRRINDVDKTLREMIERGEHRHRNL